MGSTNQPLCRFVDRLIAEKFGTAHELAKAIGMSSSAFSHGVREEGTLSFENCVRLAVAIGERPSMILKLARKPEMAAIADRAFTTHMGLSPREKDLIKTWRKLDEDAQYAHETLMQIAKEPKKPRARAVPSSGAANAADKTRAKKRGPKRARSRAGSTETSTSISLDSE
jgi:plasmid maintenance system antidote protein VapI